MEIKPLSTIVIDEVKFERQLDLIDLGNGYSVFKKQINAVGEHPDYVLVRSSTDQGICVTPKTPTEVLQTYIKPIEGDPSKYGSHFYLIVPGGRERFRREGYGECTKMGASSLFIDNVYDAVYEGKVRDISLNDIVAVDWYNHQVLNLDGTALPQAIHFDYMEGQIDNEYYKLKTLFEHLKKDPRVIFDPEYPGGQVGPEPIPSYNQEEGRTRHLPFKFVPTDEDEQAIQNLLKKKKKEGLGASWEGIFYLHDRNYSVMRLDLLNLKDTGVRKPAPVPKEPEDLDD